MSKTWFFIKNNVFLSCFDIYLWPKRLFNTLNYGVYYTGIYSKVNIICKSDSCSRKYFWLSAENTLVFLRVLPPCITPKLN